jgi:cbb3-type cytochrome c oxidase subunit III
MLFENFSTVHSLLDESLGIEARKINEKDSERINSIYVILGMAIISCSHKEKADKKPKAAMSVGEPPSSGPSDIRKGEKMFLQHCKMCHGAEAKGDIGPDLTDEEWKYGGSDSDIYTTVSNGRPGGMPGWGNKLGEEEIRNVIAYIRSLGQVSYSTI